MCIHPHPSYLTVLRPLREVVILGGVAVKTNGTLVLLAAAIVDTGFSTGLIRPWFNTWFFKKSFRVALLIALLDVLPPMAVVTIMGLVFSRLC